MASRVRFHDLAAGLRTAWTAARAANPQASAVAVLLFALLALVPLSGGAWFVWSLFIGLPDREAVARVGDMAQATEVYDRHDALAFTISKERRIEVSLASVSPRLVDAMLAIEDQRFYAHQGFDAVRIAAALFANARELRAAQGGSTITQQLARQSFLTPAKTLRRKLQELILARRLERQFPKDRILEMYLNKVYFGDGLYGVEAASRGYFGKPAAEVSVAEAALIAGLVQSPSAYAPTANPDRAIGRRDLVLQAMLDTGAIDRGTFDAARAEPLVLSDALRAGEPYGQYFKEQVRRELVDRFGWERVYAGGLRVFSTIDLEVQKAADTAVAEGLAALDARREVLARRGAGRTAPELPSDRLQTALVALDPATGHVRAMVGGRDFAESPFNRAVQARRQPGSAFKPFVFAAALEAGFTPATIIRNLNQTIPTPDGDWTPEDEQTTADELSLRTALRISSNRAAVRLLQDVGIPRTVRYMRAMGVGDVPQVPSLALGSGEVTLDALTAAYAAFANGGRVPRPMLVRRVEDRDGTVLYETEPSLTRVVSEVTAYQMASMLADVIDAGTGAGVRRYGFTLPAAGKTGTTNEFRDSWFIGFTPNLVAGVWVGFDQPRTIVPGGFASQVAVPVWASFMRQATRGHRRTWLERPDGLAAVEVCRLSGSLPTEGCAHAEVLLDSGAVARQSMVYTEYFAAGTEPANVCVLHPTRGLLGTLASWFTSDDRPTPPRLSDAVPAAPPAVAEPEPLPPPAVEAPKAPEPPRRRGFWARLFGRGNDRDAGRDRGR
jgi:penicillin-binding protein 1A